VRCLKSARNFPKYINKSADAGHRTLHFRVPADVLWVELPPVRNDVYLHKNILNLHTYFTSEDQNNKYKHIFFCLSSWGLIICNEHVLLILLQSLASLVFTSITVKVSLSVYFISNLFVWRNIGEFWQWCNVYIIARENVFHPCKNRPGTVRGPTELLRRGPGTVRHAGHWPMLS